MEGTDLSQLCGERITQLENGEVCCHGTYERHIDSILRDRLRAGGLRGPEHRRGIHFGTRNPGEYMLSGMRFDAQVAVYIDLTLASLEGILFYRSENNVISTQGRLGILPVRYFSKVWHI